MVVSNSVGRDFDANMAISSSLDLTLLFEDLNMNTTDKILTLLGEIFATFSQLRKRGTMGFDW